MSRRPHGLTRAPRLTGCLLAGMVVLHACVDAGTPAGEPSSLVAREVELVEVLRLGGLEPAEPEMFDPNPSILVDRAGRTYVLHRARGRVAVFDADGEFLHWIGGGRGQGPEEFTAPTRMGLLGDTLWIRNLSPPRISRFLTNGVHLGTDAVQIQPAHPTTAGVQGLSGYLEGGRAWVEPDGYPFALEEDRLSQATLELGSRTIESEDRDTLVTWRSNRGRMRGMTFDPIPEPPYFAVTPDGSGFGVAEWSEARPESLVVRIVNPDGVDRWSQRLAVDPEPVPAAEHDRLIAQARERVERLRESLLAQGLTPAGVPEVPSAAEAREDLYLPAHRPPIRAIRLGVDHTIWLQLTEEPSGAKWLAMDPDAGPLLEVTLPAGAIFGQATRDALWYSEMDDLGVSWLVKARFSTRSGGDAS